MIVVGSNGCGDRLYEVLVVLLLRLVIVQDSGTGWLGKRENQQNKSIRNERRMGPDSSVCIVFTLCGFAERARPKFAAGECRNSLPWRVCPSSL